MNYLTAQFLALRVSDKALSGLWHLNVKISPYN